MTLSVKIQSMLLFTITMLVLIHDSHLHFTLQVNHGKFGVLLAQNQLQTHTLVVLARRVVSRVDLLPLALVLTF